MDRTGKRDRCRLISLFISQSKAPTDMQLSSCILSSLQMLKCVLGKTGEVSAEAAPSVERCSPAPVPTGVPTPHPPTLPASHRKARGKRLGGCGAASPAAEISHANQTQLGHHASGEVEVGSSPVSPPDLHPKATRGEGEGGVG